MATQKCCGGVVICGVMPTNAVLHVVKTDALILRSTVLVWVREEVQGQTRLRLACQDQDKAHRARL